MGKTWLSAFDARQVGQSLNKRPRVLVIAHRSHILAQAEAALSVILDALGTVPFRCSKNRVVLREHVVVVGCSAMTVVAVGGRLNGRSVLQWILVAEAKESPVSRFVFESSLVFQQDLKSGELAHKVSVAARRLLRPDADEFLDENRAVRKLPGLLVLVVGLRVDVDGMEFRKSCFAVVHVVRRERCADVDPLSVS